MVKREVWVTEQDGAPVGAALHRESIHEMYRDQYIRYIPAVEQACAAPASEATWAVEVLDAFTVKHWDEIGRAPRAEPDTEVSGQFVVCVHGHRVGTKFYQYRIFEGKTQPEARIAAARALYEVDPTLPPPPPATKEEPTDGKA